MDVVGQLSSVEEPALQGRHDDGWPNCAMLYLVSPIPYRSTPLAHQPLCTIWARGMELLKPFILERHSRFNQTNYLELVWFFGCEQACYRKGGNAVLEELIN